MFTRRDPSHAQWSDLFRGEEVGNGAYLDIGRVQMFYFTFILVLAYGYTLGGMFSNSEGGITELPAVSEGACLAGNQPLSVSRRQSTAA